MAVSCKLKAVSFFPAETEHGQRFAPQPDMDTAAEYRRRNSRRPRRALLLSLAAPGVEVVTDLAAVPVTTTIHAPGRQLDGQTFTAWAGVDAETQHRAAVMLARLVAS